MKNKKRFVPWLIAAVIIAAFAVIGKKAVRFDVWRFPGSYDRGFEERHYCL